MLDLARGIEQIDAIELALIAGRHGDPVFGNPAIIDQMLPNDIDGGFGVLGRGLRLAFTGVGLGVVGALALTRLIRGMLAGVAPNDPISFGVSALLLVGGAVLACVLPARRASRVDPVVALRVE